MSYHKKTSYGQYVQVAGMGADDPWAEAASGSVVDLSKPAAPSPGKPSTVSQIGAGVGAFLSTLGKPATPTVPAGMPIVASSGMSTNTKLALAGGGALLLVLLLTRD